jgi:hypothetical protein
MIEFKPFQTKDYASGVAYDLEFSGRAVSGVGIRFSATLTGAAATFADDAAYLLIKTPEINQSENPIVRMRGRSWRHLSALGDGTYDNHIATAATASASAFLDFQKWMPQSAINAADKKIFIRGEFNALSVFSTTAPTGTTSAKMRPYTKSSQRDVTKNFFRPRFSELSVPITVANDDQQQVIKFEQDQYVSGFMVVTDDQNATAGLNLRKDNVIAALRLDITNSETGLTEGLRLGWGQARHNTQQLANFNQEDFNRSVGVIFVPLIDQRNPQANGARFFKNGDSVTFHFDSKSNMDDEYGGLTAPTLTATTTATVTTVAWTPVSGSGDTAAQVGLIDPTTRNGPTEQGRQSARRFA